MHNINQLLASSFRNDLFGYQMASRGMKKIENNRFRPEVRNGGATPDAFWDKPQPGMQGSFCLAHQVDVCDALTLQVIIDGKKTSLHPTRNHWTPAFMETVYRSDIDTNDYPHSGTLCIRDKKAILRNDVFISHLTLTNQKREGSEVELTFSMPFLEKEANIYEVNTKTMPKALKTQYPMKGFAVVMTDTGNRRVTLKIPPLGSVSLRVALAYDPKDKKTAIEKATDILAISDPFSENEKTFNHWFEDHVPMLECENTDILKVYYYRWYVVYRSIHEPAKWIDGHAINGECIYESPYGAWFGTVIGLPIALQVGDAGWMRDSTVVKNQLTNWSRGTVAFQQYIQFTPLAAWRYYQICRDKEWLASVYEGFADFCKRQLKNGIPPLTTGSWLTGAEYQPSFYQYTETPWDWRHDEEGAKEGFSKKSLYRVDAVMFLILSLRGCIRMAKELCETIDIEAFSKAEKDLTAFVMTHMWDSKTKFFYTYDPEEKKRCDKAACYDGFIPFIDSVAGEEYFSALEKIWDADWFFSEYGALTAARNCPMFWYDNCIAGPTASSVKEPHDYAASWNGPIWPFANSLVALGLGDAAIRKNDLKEKWIAFFKAYTELHFVYGDRSTPLICEHYRSDDGACFSQFPEYFHSSWIDLFMRYFAGISFEGDTPSFKPFAKEPFALYGVKLGDHIYDFIHTADGRNEIHKH